MSTYAVASEVLDAAAVVLVEVVGADLPAPAPEPETGLLRSEGPLALRVLEVLKGEVTEPAGTVRVTVRTSGRPRIDGFHGHWSSVSLDPGARLVALSRLRRGSLAELLAEDALLRLGEPGDGLVDLREATALAARHLTADALLDEAAARRASAGAAFARYVWVATREAMRADERRFDRLMRVAEDADTRIEAQSAYLLSAYEDMTVTGDFPPARRARLARAMLRSALDPRLGELRTQLLTTYLPNLVGAPVPEPLPPDAVFGPAPDLADDRSLRDELVTELDDLRDPATTSPALRAWIGGPA